LVGAGDVISGDVSSKMAAVSASAPLSLRTDQFAIHGLQHHQSLF